LWDASASNSYSVIKGLFPIATQKLCAFGWRAPEGVLWQRRNEAGLGDEEERMAVAAAVEGGEEEDNVLGRELPRANTKALARSSRPTTVSRYPPSPAGVFWKCTPTDTVSSAIPPATTTAN
jgi:hypothetical protein